MGPHKRNFPQGHIVDRYGLIRPVRTTVRCVKDHPFRQVRGYAVSLETDDPCGVFVKTGNPFVLVMTRGVHDMADDLPIFQLYADNAATALPIHLFKNIIALSSDIFNSDYNLTQNAESLMVCV